MVVENVFQVTVRNGLPRHGKADQIIEPTRLAVAACIVHLLTGMGFIVFPQGPVVCEFCFRGDRFVECLVTGGRLGFLGLFLF